MAMDNITAKALYDRLRAIYDDPADEALAPMLGISYSMLKRLKKGSGPGFKDAVPLLDVAGFLRRPSELPPLEQSRAEAETGRAERLRKALAEAEARSRSQSGRTRRRREEPDAQEG